MVPERSLSEIKIGESFPHLLRLVSEESRPHQGATVTQAPASDQPSGPEKTYFRELNAGNFQIQLCESCDKHVFYPRAVCPHCGSGSLKWVKPSGRGTEYSTTVVRRKPDAGGDHNVALVNLEEG